MTAECRRFESHLGQLIFSLEKSVVIGVVELFTLHFVVYHLTMIYEPVGLMYR